MWKIVTIAIILIIAGGSGKGFLEDVPGTVVLAGVWMIITLWVLILISINIEKMIDQITDIRNDINNRRWEDV